MFKDTISYEDFNGNTINETLYFNLSKPELIKLETSYPGGYVKQIEKIQEEIAKGEDSDLSGLIDFYELFISESYGIKSEDGTRFIKNAEIKEAFLQSNAYSTIFMKLITDEDYVTKFFMGIIPSDIANAIESDQSTEIVS